MAIERFPDPRTPHPDGIVGIGGDLDIESLRLAYRQGIFPWPIEGMPLPWFCPHQRGILEFSALHVPRSLSRALRKSSWTYSIDRDFKNVIESCAEQHQPTWITPEMLDAYLALYRAGFAHSIEVREGDQIVGGIYGVDCDGAFACESMFYLKPNASKAALLHLIEHLRARGLDWIDIQMVTPHMEALGAREVTRDVFLDRLSATQRLGLKLF